ncbi:MAG: hypothetical protein Q8L70_02850 [Methylotenera sp.]|nr:hypothetical protein [Methylotenera sp.]MDP1959755.1 hypothetical protein [Methylotenera sp.]MDP3942591.1 hypothetical protein [Methylotenera sp.]
MPSLLAKTSYIGDAIHNLAVITDIRVYHPHATFDWLVEERLKNHLYTNFLSFTLEKPYT